MANPDDYSAIFVTRGLAQLEVEVYKTIDFLILDGTPTQAAALKRAYDGLLAELRRIAQDIAQKAERYIKDEELDSRLRPAPTGDSPSLQDFIGRSDPLPGVDGAVGVNDESVLYDNVDWWWTQEEGYGGHVGREVKGYFFDSGFVGPSAPNPAQFRVHPLFVAGATASAAGAAIGFSGYGAGPRGGKGRRMTIRNPIPARRFVQRGAQRAEAEWHREHARARARFEAEVARLLAIPGRRRP